MTDPTPPEHPPLSERERIQALLDAGRISESEAELLFAALDDEAREAYEAEDFTLDGSAPLPPKPPEPPSAAWEATGESWREADAAAERPNTAETTHADPYEDDAVGVRRWIKIAGGCGDLSITVDPSLDAPTFTGEGVLEQDGEDYRLRTPSDWKGGNWLSKLSNLVGSLEVRVPEGYGVVLSIFAGDGELRGVRAVKGKFTGGDLSVHGAESLNLNVTSGDVKLSLRPTRGHHQLRATSGDVTLTLLKGSDVTVSGKATAGNVSVPKGFGRSGSFGSSKVQGTVGGGRAKLELRLTAGNVELRAEDV